MKAFTNSVAFKDINFYERACYFDVLITPDDASEIIDAQDNLRKANAQRVRLFSKSSELGEIVECAADPLMFDGFGRLRNGQHRAKMVVSTGKPYRFRVETMCPEELIRAHDRGLPRSIGSAVRFDEDVALSTRIGSILRTAIACETQNGERQTDGVYLAVNNLNEEGWIFAAECNRTRSQPGCRVSVCTALGMYFHANESRARAFWDTLAQADGPVQPARMLRDYLLRNGGAGNSGAAQVDHYRRTITAITAYHESRTLEVVRTTNAWPVSLGLGALSANIRRLGSRSGARP